MLVESETQRDAAPAPAAPAPNTMFIKDALSKMSQTLKISYFSHSDLY
jgi:hypothetical protein